MNKGLREISGIQKLLEKYRRTFRIPENLNYYSEADYRIAEKKYLKFVLKGVKA
jgi:hypothetical protein